MSPVIKGSVRRNQLISTYGVGSIVPLGDESFMIAGIDRWNVAEPDIHEPRLERELGVPGFVRPPASEDDKRPDVPVVRFPIWSSCPTCHRLDSHRFFTSFDGSRCGTCDEPLVPSRFVVACTRGHIDDFPYWEWAHHGSHSRPAQVHDMRLDSMGTTASLRDIVVGCSCGAERSLEGAFRGQALKPIVGCRGKRPWLDVPPEPCDELPRTLQRGASNVWYGVDRSALSIPPWSEGAYRALNRYWFIVGNMPEEGLAEMITNTGLAKKSGYAVSELVAAVVARKAVERGFASESTDLRGQEYEALVKGRPEITPDQDFVCVPTPVAGSYAGRWLDRVMAVTRLREVRALQGFTRVLPPSPSDDPARRASLFAVDPGWLPAIEVMGEGVFLKLNDDMVDAWERRPRVAARAAKIDANYQARFAAFGKPADRVITPRFLLVHTLAHLLINQWSLECGYPTASLRERIYADGQMAGILIYTATSDSAGSLGGIVALADPDRLAAALAETLQRAGWCSSDPLCSESQGSGVDALNLAACHACVLLPEVSCEWMNTILDRAAVVATSGEPDVAFFLGEDL